MNLGVEIYVFNFFFKDGHNHAAEVLTLTAEQHSLWQTSMDKV